MALVRKAFILHPLPPPRRPRGLSLLKRCCQKMVLIHLFSQLVICYTLKICFITSITSTHSLKTSLSPSSKNIRRAFINDNNSYYDQSGNKNSKKNNSYGNGGVQIQVEQDFPGMSPIQVKEAWMSYHWKNGGGLFGVTILTKNNSLRRRVLPIWMEESLISRSDDIDMDKNEMEGIKYTVTDMGLFSSEIEQGSHSAEVRFIKNKKSTESNTSTKMIWDVTFRAIQRRNIWKSVTETNIRTVAENLASYLATPYLYKQITNLYLYDDKKNITSKWLDFVWKDGGGLPIPAFMLVPLDDRRRMYVPPFLIERIVSIKPTDTIASNYTTKSTDCHELGNVGEFRYCVDNPGLFTYQVHTHTGRVRFQTIIPNNDTKIDSATIGYGNERRETRPAHVQMIWEVEIRPLRGFESFVQLFTSSVISTISRNFKTHINEPGTMISLKLPRGGFGINGALNETVIDNIPKDTWIGGVLDAHLSDERSTIEQTISLFQPWTWGQCDNDHDSSEEKGVWSRGFISIDSQ